MMVDIIFGMILIYLNYFQWEGKYAFLKNLYQTAVILTQTSTFFFEMLSKLLGRNSYLLSNLVNIWCIRYIFMRGIKNNVILN